MNIIEELPELLTDVNIPFKISAGPGAGKTTWLVNHVQNVLKVSERLNKVQKIACITYTRIGAETVEKSVKKITGTNRLDTGTIHSFLYRNVIKPFSYLIEKDDEGEELFCVDEICGLIENRLNHGRFSSWKKDRIKEKSFYLLDEGLKDESGSTNLEKTYLHLNNIEWKIENDKVQIGIGKKYRPALLIVVKGNLSKIGISNRNLFEYKKKHWSKGIMHHEDVLYFTHYIFTKNPRVVEFISNKFPYLFLDEFQDTNPLQTWIINRIAKSGTIIGVIGDPAQSIFEFAGARRKDFNNFTLPQIRTYKKSHNFRSTHKIVDFLKCLRNDIEQEPKEDAIIGNDIVILVGEPRLAIEEIRVLDEDYAILCRSNKDVNKLKHNVKEIDGDNLIDLLYLTESDHRRHRFIHSLIKAYDFYENEEYKESINEIKKHLKGSNLEGIEKRKIAIKILEYLKVNQNSTIEQIYKYWQPILKVDFSISFTGLSKTKPIHENQFMDFIPHLSKQTVIGSKIRTIHQAKGAEFKNVLLCLFDKKDKNGKVMKKIETILLDSIFNAKESIVLDNEKGEETRLIYVACSRAKERLFINVPRLSLEEENKLCHLKVVVQRFNTEV